MVTTCTPRALRSKRLWWNFWFALVVNENPCQRTGFCCFCHAYHGKTQLTYPYSLAPCPPRNRDQCLISTSDGKRIACVIKRRTMARWKGKSVQIRNGNAAQIYANPVWKKPKTEWQLLHVQYQAEKKYSCTVILVPWLSFDLHDINWYIYFTY